MKGIPTTPETQDRIVKLAKMGYDRVSVAEMLGISIRTVSKYAGGIFVSNEWKCVITRSGPSRMSGARNVCWSGCRRRTDMGYIISRIIGWVLCVALRDLEG